MPITARLSKKFYEKFGEDLAQEMVDWFNQMDQTYRADLTSLNELNFARFDAKLEQRAAELGAKIEQRTAELDAKIELRSAELRIEMAKLRADLIKWMFVFWLGTVGSFVAVARLLLT
jgi:hypothetical protein